MAYPLRKVVIVDDHTIFRAGLRAGLGPTIQVVGEAGTVEEAIPLVRAADPDVVLLDVHLPDGGGDAVIAPVHAERPGVRFLALSVSDSPEDILATIRAGARGYVTKSITPERLVAAIHRVADGDAVFSPWLAGFVLDAFSGRSATADPAARIDPERDSLTAREQDVLLLIARGYTNRQVAERLHLSIKTIETHVSNVLRKLQLTNRNALTRWAAQRRMI
ncbi:response regulator transcription factor [Conexibacter sp. JD483]|uniref:response regulator n=1 Tax=unclassified Conexibacter TaxID=2627773 RepID=UPI00271B256D|nr:MULTISPECIES: response regulator transcription factor [unclassified Conexibacter]MDO8186439.1 response regulator transcription factor [Conexibacter sp. CPCC 205706]MDO8200008.1 response regulator transcription factor [Conexibacter sp. CPCC 205762]MDR9370561.1 response regulator transcription factor [Conexibacter sp. JD483]